MRNEAKFSLGEGTVQCYVLRESPWLMHFFGRAEYQREKPVMSDSIRSQAQPIVDAMNSGTITVEDGLRQLEAF